MKIYSKIAIGLTILFLLGAGFWLKNQYAEIKRVAYEKREVDIIKYINDKALDFGLVSAFAEKNVALQQKMFQDFFNAIQTPELFRVKVFDLTPKIVWSNLPEIIGQDASQNQNALNALKGISNVGFKSVPGEPKVEHISERQFTDFTETYLPVKDKEGKIIGVFEVYQSMNLLNKEIQGNFLKVVIPTAFFVVAVYIILMFVFRFFLKAPIQQ